MENATVTKNDRVGLLVSLVDEAFNRNAWHGPTLWGALRGVTSEQAAWRPAPDRHNIWEIAVHAAYWKHMVRRRITGDRRLRFPLRGKDWFVRPAAAGESDWHADLGLLRNAHRELRTLVADLSPADLAGDRAGERRAHMIRGSAAHDVYHAGQIQLLKRLNHAG